MDNESKELLNFYLNISQDIKATLLSEEEGGSSEQIFTQIACGFLTSAGETEDVRLAYDGKGFGTVKQHQVNGYSISDNYETLDLFITIHKFTKEPIKTTKDEIETALKRIVNFFRKAIYKDYVNEIEESSEIFQLANELANNKELRDSLVRINVIVLTDGIYNGALLSHDPISSYSIYPRVVDLTYLLNISIKSYIPIELDFKADGFDIPCIESPSENEDYKSYLAIFRGDALANIYERFGARLLEQNVRSFLQFTGKINKGIRNTIIHEPQMFLAFNNGISATANNIELDENGKISKLSDLQIVNGGQTTASIYHTYKKDKADISKIYIQVKLSIIKNKEKFSEIVSRIAEYANTQNKVSVADLSSNKPFHIHFEVLSRAISTPYSEKNPIQTKWFYERARGQYKNARLKDGFTPSRQKAFDLKNPKGQIFTKELLAKYLNAYEEVYKERKLVIGPHYVIKSIKNYSQFVLHYTNINIENNKDFYQESVAKAILYRACETLYGQKPNSIGDLRFITVPYSITYFGVKTDYKLDLQKIWRNQAISEQLINLLYKLMVQVDSFLKTNSPESLIEMWARKEDCWEMVRKQDFKLDLNSIKDDLNIERKLLGKVKPNSANEIQELQRFEDIERIKSVPFEIWKSIEKWGRDSNNLSSYQYSIVDSILGHLKNKRIFKDIEIVKGLEIIETVIDKAPEILVESDDSREPDNSSGQIEVTLDIINRIIEWDRVNKKLWTAEFEFFKKLSIGEYSLTELNKNRVSKKFPMLKKMGFEF